MADTDPLAAATVPVNPTARPATVPLGRRRHWGGFLLWALVAVQSLAGGYFLWTILAALLGLPELPLRWQAREMLDLAATLGLVFGAVLTVRLAWAAARAGDRAETARRLTAGAFTRVVDEYFDVLGLTGAEREVAWYIVKGFGQSEIAHLRGTAEGTVRVQSTAIYRKAGVSGKSQLLSQILEDLLL
ncbi:MAG: helix-turn-helix transcriptional regulator [Maritimibacter sp.]|nr:helix-turn-helix transcriptional regulator [Maritimibacter sp.]